MDEEQSLFRSFGAALAEWSKVEAQSYVLYTGMMAGANPDLISVNWHSIQSFDSKITLIDRCAEFVLTPSVFKDTWSPILKRIRAGSLERNLIAHGTIMSCVEASGNFSPLYFGPSILDATAKLRGRLDNRHFEYNSGRLDDLKSTFGLLAADISQFTLAHFPHARIDQAY